MKTIQIVGPYFTNYSLARVNRGLGLALSKQAENFETNLWCPDDRIDWKPTEKELKANLELDELVLRKEEESDVVIYNNTPAGVDGLHQLENLAGKIIIPMLPWEESVYPKPLVDEVNKYAHAVFSISEFSSTILRKSGIQVPVFTTNIGIDESFIQNSSKNFPIETNKKFKFVHVSTARKRKGVDVLLKAYFNSFSKNDDVTLIIKSFPNPDNLVDELLHELKTDQSPEVVHINRPDLSEEEMKSLIEQADCAVYPSRAEGFGLPIAEAMLVGTPVITTNYSGQLDFANEENSYLIDYKITLAKDSEMINLGARWAEPSVEDLANKLKQAYTDITEKNETYKQKVNLAQSRAKELTWDATAKKVTNILSKFENIQELKEKTVAVICPRNSQDGIALYNKHLYQVMQSNFSSVFFLANKDIADRTDKDEENVVRTWETGEVLFAETIEFIEKNNIDIIHIQYHSGAYFPIEGLDKLISKLQDRKVIVELHAVQGEGFDVVHASHHLKDANTVVVHNQKDLEYIQQSISKGVLIPLAEKSFPQRSASKVKKELGLDQYDVIVSTHGLLNKNKNVPLLLESFAEFRKEHSDSLFIALSAVSSNNIHSGKELEEVQKVIKKHKLEENVVIIQEFLDRAVLEILLQATDVIVLPYSDAGESASAAVRTCMAAKKPVIVSNIHQFSEFTEGIVKLENVNIKTIVQGITNVLEPSKKDELLKQSEALLEKNSFENKALELMKLMNH